MFINGGPVALWAPDFQTLVADLEGWLRRGFSGAIQQSADASTPVWFVWLQRLRPVRR